MRSVIDAKLKGEGIDLADEEEPDRSNVIDLMSALKQSLGEGKAAKPAAKAKKAPAKKPVAAKRGRPTPRGARA